ncbi:hypothetical protein [Brevundimonas sp.]|jgi:hypothetical protein|nr:hypothetical protein [Brevundimonas sp.]
MVLTAKGATLNGTKLFGDSGLKGGAIRGGTSSLTAARFMWMRRPSRDWYRADAPASLSMKLLKSLNACRT